MENGVEEKIEPGDFSPLEFGALIWAVCIAFSSQMVMPLWVGAVIDDYGLSKSVVGTIAAVEMAAVAIVSLTMAVQVHRFKPLQAVAIGMGCLLVGNLLSALLQEPYWLALCRIVVGAGKGMVVTICFSLAAGVSHPTRAFAVLNASYALFSTVFFLLVPPVISSGGASAVFFLLAAMVAISAIGLLRLPRRRMQGSDLKALRFRDIENFGFVAFAALVMLWIGHNAIWTFIERLGLRIDLSPIQVGQVLSVAAFVTIGGPFLARLIDTRFGHIGPIAVAMAIKLIVILLLVYTSLPWLYAVLVPTFLFLALFMLPYFMGILSSADPAGRLAAAASAAMTMGSSLGALFGGWTADSTGYLGLGWMAAAYLGLAFLLIILVARQLSGRPDPMPV